MRPNNVIDVENTRNTQFTAKKRDAENHRTYLAKEEKALGDGDIGRKSHRSSLNQ